MAKISRPVIYVGLAAIGIAAWLLTEKKETPTTIPKGRTSIARVATATGAFTEEDYKAEFARLNEPIRNAFNPLIKASPKSLPGLGGPSNAVPASFANGEANWIYTGTAIVDDVPTALVENTGSGEGVFLKQGEAWKTSRVQRITPDTLTLGNNQGQTFTMRLYFEPIQNDILPEVRPIQPGPPPGGPGGAPTPGGPSRMGGAASITMSSESR